MMLPMAVARSSSGGVAQFQGEGTILGGFFPTATALYSIAFGIHTKTAEPIEMPFKMMILVGTRYHMLDGGPDLQRKKAILGKNVAAHCTVMGHSTVSCAKTAEPIEIL